MFKKALIISFKRYIKKSCKQIVEFIQNIYSLQKTVINFAPQSLNSLHEMIIRLNWNFFGLNMHIFLLSMLQLTRWNISKKKKFPIKFDFA